MRKFYYAIFGLAALLFLQVSCHNFEPIMCTVTLSQDLMEHGSLDKDYVPIGSIVTLTIDDSDIPEDSYMVVDTKETRGFIKQEGNKYYFYVSYEQYKISGSIRQKAKFNIYTYYRNPNGYNSTNNLYELTCSAPMSAYEGQKVFIEFNPEQGYKPANLSIITRYRWETIEYTQETPVIYSFIMPADAVEIRFNYTIDLIFSTDKDVFILGEPVVFNVSGYTSSNIFDLYVKYKETDWMPLEKSVDLSNGTYEIINPEIGICSIGVKSFYTKETEVITTKKIVPENLEDGWNVSYLNVEVTPNDFYQIVEFHMKQINYYNYNAVYYFERNPAITYNNKYTIFHVDYVYDEPDYLVLQIYDTDLKLVSGTKRFLIPCYTDVFTNYQENISYEDLGFSTIDDFLESTFEVSEQDQEYFTITKNIEEGVLVITSNKPTAIERTVVVKDSYNTQISTIEITIPYKDPANYKIIK